MRVIDDQGRIFGKVNIIDAAVLIVVCLLIPLAYSAYLLFRVPPPQVLAVEPARVSQSTTEVMIRGQYLRPYLRMSVGDKPAGFFFGTPERGMIALPQLPPGTHDVVLYDETQELGRLSGGLVVTEPSSLSAGLSEKKVVNATTELLAIGSFRGLDLTGARELSRQLERLKQRAMPWGAIRGFQRPETNLQLTADAIPVSDGKYQIRAVLQLRCAINEDQCRTGDGTVRIGTAVAIDISDDVSVPFLIEEVHPIYDSRIELRIQATVSAAVASLLRRDAPGTFPARDVLQPTYASFEVVDTTKDGTQTGFISLRLPAVKVRDAWYYENRPLRLGESFTFEMPQYSVLGPIVSIRSIGRLQDAS